MFLFSILLVVISANNSQFLPRIISKKNNDKIDNSRWNLGNDKKKDEATSYQKFAQDLSD